MSRTTLSASRACALLLIAAALFMAAFAVFALPAHAAYNKVAPDESYTDIEGVSVSGEPLTDCV